MKKLIIVIPAYNEEEILEKNILKLYNYAKKNIKNYNWEIIVGNNASIDKTLQIAQKLSKKYKEIRFVDRKTNGKSATIKAIWLDKDADYYMYMDADLSTDIGYTLQLIKALEKGYDIAIGSRTIKTKSKRSLKREIVSFGFKLILKIFFLIKLKDSQCGFKIINKKVRDNIIPKMKALNYGFMDTEMLLIAFKKDYKIKEIPVTWKDERISKINIFRDIIDTMENILKIRIDLFLGRY